MSGTFNPDQLDFKKLEAETWVFSHYWNIVFENLLLNVYLYSGLRLLLHELLDGNRFAKWREYWTLGKLNVTVTRNSVCLLNFTRDQEEQVVTVSISSKVFNRMVMVNWRWIGLYISSSYGRKRPVFKQRSRTKINHNEKNKKTILISMFKKSKMYQAFKHTSLAKLGNGRVIMMTLYPERLASFIFANWQKFLKILTKKFLKSSLCSALLLWDQRHNIVISQTSQFSWKWLFSYRNFLFFQTWKK